MPSAEGKKAAEVAKELLAGNKVEKNIYLPLEIMVKADLPKWGKICSY